MSGQQAFDLPRWPFELNDRVLLPGGGRGKVVGMWPKLGAVRVLVESDDGLDVVFGAAELKRTAAA